MAHHRIKLGVVLLASAIALGVPAGASAAPSAPSLTMTQAQVDGALKHLCARTPWLSICRPGKVNTALVAQYFNVTCARAPALSFCKPGGGGSGGWGGGAGGGGGGGGHPGTGLTLWPLGLGGILCIGGSLVLLRRRAALADLR